MNYHMTLKAYTAQCYHIKSHNVYIF